MAFWPTPPIRSSPTPPAKSPIAILAPPTLSAIESGVAAAILKTPSQPIATDSGGDVSLSSDTLAALLDGITTDAIAGGVLDQTNGIEVGLTVRQALRLIASANVGNLTGAGTGTIVYRRRRHRHHADLGHR